MKSLRIPFEAIVELGDDDPGAAFEAQGVNLSPSGMHLRTAYLPEVGQSLLCRFGSGAQEIQAEADVVWTKHAARGGEFGIRFTNVDGASAAALMDMCGPPRTETTEETSSVTRNEADEGTRVRLHIDGLSSPMKARVRGAVGKELLVGSNLEFLKVGRSIELENVDDGGKRPAHIDRVDVELDRDSRVPQLVVTLRYDDMSADPPPVVPFPSSPPPYFQSPVSSVPAATSDAASEAPTIEKAVVSLPPPPPAVIPVPAAKVAASDPDDDRTPEEIEIAKMMRSKASVAASDAMVKVAALGVRARAAFGEALGKALSKSRSGDAASGAPRRKTSPPPGGALHASGKRVVRESDDNDGEGETVEKRAKFGRKTMVVAGGATAVVALSVIGLLSRSPAAPPPGETKAAEPTAQAPATPPAETPVNASGGVEAKVPLFGATTVATAEVPAAAVPAPMSAQSTPASPINRTLAFGGTPSFGEAAEPPASAERKADGDDKSGKAHGKAQPFGHGKVEHAMVLRIKTDGTIGDMHGVRTAGGFTLTLPGRKTLDTGAALAARDSRIAKVNVSNNAKGSELTFHFKGGVPAYLVSPNGRDLQLSLSRAESTQGSKDSAHRSATAQKRGQEASHRSNKR
ncbi:MAG: PilZ domain-containing protein [Polyangiaceae bacterium]